MHQIFVPIQNFKEKYVVIEGRDFHHLVNVLRVNINEKLFIVVNRGHRFIGNISSIEKNKLLVDLIEKIEENYDPTFDLHVAQSIPKGKKFEDIIKYGTELGVNAFFPLITERTITKLNDAKIDRLRRIAKEEAQISKRDKIPDIFNPVKFLDFLKLSNAYNKKYIFWELEDEKSLDEIDIKKNDKVIIVIGNEGGFGIEEVLNAKKSGFVSISLGKRILRSELAPLVIISLIFYKGGEFRI